MPIVVRHAGPIAALTGLAANVGAQATNHENLHDNLALDEFGLQQQQAEAHVQQNQQAQALQAIQSVMQDARQREINAVNVAGRSDVADLNGQYAQQRMNAQQAGATTRSADQIISQEERAKQADQARRDIAEGRNSTTIRGQDMRSGQFYDGLQQRYDQMDATGKRATEQMTLRKVLADAQQAQRQGNGARAAALAHLHAEISELTKQRDVVLEGIQRGTWDRGQGAELVQRLTGEIGARINRVTAPAAAAAPVMAQPAPSPGVPGAPPPVPYDAQQPGMGVPAPSMSNPALQTGMPPPQSMGSPDAGPVRVATVEQARQLPPGTQFLDPYGTLRVVA